jgi:hypothetical protein
VNCGEVVVRLSADMDGELTESESLDVCNHLLSCAHCARKRTLLEDTRLAFRSAATVNPRSNYARSFAVSAALTAVVAIGVMVARSPVPSSARTDGRQLLGIECGMAGSTNCIVDQPCRDGQCSADDLVPGLR